MDGDDAPASRPHRERERRERARTRARVGRRGGRLDRRRQPIVAVIIPALNEAGKIGRVLDKLPKSGWFEAIVVDDGSTDGTGDEARAHGAAVVIRHDERGGVGAAIRDGWKEGLRRNRPYLALLSGDDQHEPAELITALAALEAAGADYAQGSRWRKGGRVVGPIGGRGFGTRLYSLVFSVLALRRVTDATNGFRIFKADILRDPRIDLDQEWLTSYDLEPYVLYKAIRARVQERSRCPARSATTPRRATRRCAASATGGASSGRRSCSRPG